MIKSNYIFAILIGIVISITVWAQDMDKEVYVISSFKPIISDAEKIGRLPSLSDTVRLKPNVEYSILPSKIETNYEIHPIKSATMVGTPLSKLYNSYLKLGLGNYTTPLAEFSIQNLRSKEYSIGAYIFHKSSYSKLKLDNGHKVPAGYGTNIASVYGKCFFKDVNLEGNIDFDSDRYRFYGYNIDNFTDSLPDIERSDIKHSYYNIGADVALVSTNPDSGAFQYKLAVTANYLHDHQSFEERHFGTGIDLTIPVGSFKFGLDANYNYYGKLLNTPDVDNSIVEIHPTISKGTYLWQAQVGMKAFFDNGTENNRYFFPEASIRFQVINDILITFFGIKGDLEVNNYRKILTENKYIRPGEHIVNTKHNLIAWGGVEGILSRKSGYRVDVHFLSTENNYFFVNDTTTLLENHFVAEYDDADLIKYYGELYYSPFSYLTLFLKSNIYSYRMAEIEKPWHIPEYTIDFAVQYNLQEKIYAQLDLINFGKRYAKDTTSENGVKQLDPVWDLNLRLEYRYSKILSGFVDIYNILSQKYMLWNNYPSQRINLILGVTYKF